MKNKSHKFQKLILLKKKKFQGRFNLINFHPHFEPSTQRNKFFLKLLYTNYDCYINHFLFIYVCKSVSAGGYNTDVN